MTAARYTSDQLHAMSGRELDAVVAEVVMGFTRRYSVGFLYSIAYLVPPDYPLEKLPAGMAESCPFDNGHQFSLQLVPEYSTTWANQDQIIGRMEGLGFSYVASANNHGCGALFRSRENPAVVGKCEREATLPRATAIAAVLAVQGVADV